MRLSVMSGTWLVVAHQRIQRGPCHVWLAPNLGTDSKILEGRPKVHEQEEQQKKTTQERADLHPRGWTDGLIKKHLSVAWVEMRRIAPYRFSRVYHYSVQQILEAEALPEVQSRLQANIA